MKALLPTSGPSGATSSRRTRNNCASGPTPIRRLSAINTPWCRPRSPAWKGGNPMPCACTSRPFNRRASMDSCRTRAWPMRSPHGSTWARGFETFANAYLRNARSCYLRWGAHGKVRQLDRLYPHLAVAEGHGPTATIGSTQQLDVASIVKASQALSSEIELPKLIERLMTIAIENGGADRGLLILPAGEDYLIQAQAKATGDRSKSRWAKHRSPGSPVPIPSSAMSSAHAKA